MGERGRPPFLASLFLAGLVLAAAACGPEPIPSGSSAPPDTVPGKAIPSPLMDFIASRPPEERAADRVAMLDTGSEALTARIHLIRSARRSLALQTIIRVNDEVERLLMYELLEAARRGKVFIADGIVGITGGRNNENACYDQARGLNYRDRDVLVTGRAGGTMEESFNAFWGLRASVPLEKLVDLKAAAEGVGPRAGTEKRISPFTVSSATSWRTLQTETGWRPFSWTLSSRWREPPV